MATTCPQAKRLGPLRGFRGAALPGQSLVVFDPDLDLVVDLAPGEDGHAQESTLLPAVLAHAQAGDLWIADRNFSTRTALVTLATRLAAFIFREHSVSPSPTPAGPRREVGCIETGVVYEQRVTIPLPNDNDSGKTLVLRRIELALDHPTEDGDTSLRLLTNLPEQRFDACAVARLYRKRWTIEGLEKKRLREHLATHFAKVGLDGGALERARHAQARCPRSAPALQAPAGMIPTRGSTPP